MEGLNRLLSEQIEPSPMVSVFGLFQVSQSIVTSWCIIAILVLASALLTRNLKRIPGKGQMVLEMAVGGFNNFCTQNLGKHGKTFAPWLGSIGLFILACNLSAFVVAPPTKDLSITASLALMSVVLIYGGQLRYRGVGKGLKKFAEPYPFLLPFNLMEIAIRPLSLCMRLFGNVLATFLIMEMIKYLVPFVIPAVFSIYFDLFDGIIQAVVFVFLTTLFLGEGIEEHDE